MPQEHGILLINKPKGISSAKCVGKIKALGQKKIGHAGTLDPMATGVLIVLLGNATKLSNYLLEGGEKTYLACAQLGRITDTWDDEGETLETRDFSNVSPQDIEKEISAWLGASTQIVPSYSAAKHNGQPLYKLARSGQEVPEKKKEIYISHAQVQLVNLPYVRFRVTCSSGSYIRSLAHSLGMRLGCGATLTELTREYSHPYSLDQTWTLETLQQEPELLSQKVLPLSSALPSWTILQVSGEQKKDLLNGKPIEHLPAWGDYVLDSRAILYYGEEGMALAQAQIQNGQEMWVILRGLFTANS